MFSQALGFPFATEGEVCPKFSVLPAPSQDAGVQKAKRLVLIAVLGRLSLSRQRVQQLSDEFREGDSLCKIIFKSMYSIGNEDFFLNNLVIHILLKHYVCSR